MRKYIEYEVRREVYQKRHVLYNKRDDKEQMKRTNELKLEWCQKEEKKLIMIDVEESCESVSA